MTIFIENLYVAYFRQEHFSTFSYLYIRGAKTLCGLSFSITSILRNSESLSDFHCSSSLVVRRYVPNKNHYSVRFFFSSNKACCYDILLLETDYRLDWAGLKSRYN